MPITDNLLAYYKLEEGAGANRADSSGNAKTLTDSGSTANAAGLLGNAASFAAATLLERDSDSAWGIGGADWTIAFWCKRSAAFQSGGMRIDAAGGDISVQIAAHGLNDDGDDKPTVVIWYGGGSSTVVQNTTDITNGVWNFIVARYTFASPAVDISINNNTPASGAVGGAMNTSSTRLRVGQGTTLVTGLMDAVGIWTRKLSDAEVTTLYNAGAGLEYPWSAALVAGVASLQSSGPGGIVYTSTNASGGVGGYTYAWERSDNGGAFATLTNGGGVSGATTLTVTDGSAVAGHVYDVRPKFTDTVPTTVTGNTVRAQIYTGGTIGGGGGLIGPSALVG